MPGRVLSFGLPLGSKIRNQSLSFWSSQSGGRGTLISKSTNKYKLQWWSSDDIIRRVSLCRGSGRAAQGE